MDSPADGNSYLPGLEKKKQLCMYYMDGGCRFGEYCKFVHGLQCSICEKPYLYPDDPVQNEKHTSQCELEKERETSEHLKCEMCNKKVVDSGRKFGILPSCDCVFCVPCIREVRNNALESECPVCGKASHFVVPCYGWPRNAARKELVVSLYREKLRKIPCKYFDNGKGTCRFGSACHYAHVDTEGNAVVPEQARAVVDARGEYQQYSTLNLGMFLNIQKKEKKKS
jgi:E3 ubiquitin-protein ligase makorin